MDDEAAGFSKRKYENLNDKRRRMGDKKTKLKKNKSNSKMARRVAKRAISKKKWSDDVTLQTRAIDRQWQYRLIN